MLFSQAMRETVKAENPDVSFGTIGKLLGQKWKELSDADKEVRRPLAALSRIHPSRLTFSLPPFLQPYNQAAVKCVSHHIDLPFVFRRLTLSVTPSAPPGTRSATRARRPSTRNRTRLRPRAARPRPPPLRRPRTTRTSPTRLISLLSLWPSARFSLRQTLAVGRSRVCPSFAPSLRSLCRVLGEGPSSASIPPSWDRLRQALLARPFSNLRVLSSL